jgi:replicative superfamily II helicase
MIGRAGRPGFDTHADAVVMVRAEMKEYYKRVSFNTILHRSLLPLY